MTRSQPLSELRGQWHKFTLRNAAAGEQPIDVLYFECPACPRNTAGGVHGILACVTPGRSMYESGAVWSVVGGAIGSIAGLTLAPSIDCSEGGKGDCKFHGYVRDGQVTW